MLGVKEVDRQLYLAVPSTPTSSLFQSRFAKVAIERHQLKLIVYDPIAEEIMTWTH